MIYWLTVIMKYLFLIVVVVMPRLVSVVYDPNMALEMD
jgi:hypothetical protein